MNNYKLGQRWISETEPELGLGIITKVEDRLVNIFFAASEQTRCYASDNAPLFRVLFKKGDSITLESGETVTIHDVKEEDNVITYILTDTREIHEKELSSKIGFSKPDERLLHGKCDDNVYFDLRQEARKLYHSFRGSRCCGLAGARIDLLGHQLYVADKVVSMEYPRVLLADEVGLGKTIEAGLILHRLLLVGRAERVIIMLPETLIHQWFVELLRRFNLKFNIFDEDRCLAIEDTSPEGNPFNSEQLIIVGIDYLLNNPDRAEQVLECSWDLLIVDEAHHLKWTKEEVGEDYKLVEQISKIANSVLLLTATPEQLGIESHFARLHLLDPQRYSSLENFYIEIEQYNIIAKITSKILKAKKLSEEDMNVLLNGKHQTPELEKMLNEYQQDQSGENELLLQELIDLYGVGRNIYRNTRAAVKGFPTRKYNQYLLNPKNDELQECFAEYYCDLGEQEESIYSYDDDARIEWLAKFIKNTDEKVLVICHTKNRAIAINEALINKVGAPLAVFHEDLSIIQRDRNAAWFAETYGAQVLICSEIGSEGRNFQFSYNLVLFDLPLMPEILEQRIGRLARLGQTEVVQVHTPVIKGSPQEYLAKWYHEGLDAFETILEGGWQLAKEFLPKINDFLKSESVEDKQFKLLIKDSKEKCKIIRKKLEEGRDYLLEMNSYRPEVSKLIINEIEHQDQNEDLEPFMLKAFDCFGVQVESVNRNTYAVQAQDLYADAFPMLPEEGGQITFDRKKALVNELTIFMSIEHPMCIGAMDWINSSEKGNSACAHWQDDKNVAIYLETYFIIQSIAPAQWNIGRFLPPTPIRILLDHAKDDITDKISESMLAQNIEDETPGWLLSRPKIKHELIPSLIELAKNKAKQMMPPILIEAEEKAYEHLQYELARAEALFAKGVVEKEFVNNRKQMKENIIKAIQSASINMDSIRIIWRGSK